MSYIHFHQLKKRKKEEQRVLPSRVAVKIKKYNVCRALESMPGTTQLFNKCSLVLLSEVGESTDFLLQGPWTQSPRSYQLELSPGCWLSHLRFHFSQGTFKSALKIISMVAIEPQNYTAGGNTDANTE